MDTGPVADTHSVENPSSEGMDGGSLARLFLGMDAAGRAAGLENLTLEEALQLEADVHALVRGDLASWCRLALCPAGFSPARHHLALIGELEAIASGENDRLMVWMPPGSAKSTYASHLFPAWFMARQPYQNVLGASNTSGLAETFSKKVQDFIRDHSGVLKIGLTSEAVGSWSTSNKCEYFAAGVGSAIAGRRADLAIIDDPFKTLEEADNQERRDKVWDWFKTDFLTRLKPTGRIVLINTRWHHDDLSGKILEHEPERWRVVSFPAIAEENDALGRAVGEPLWPEWEPLSALLDKQRTMGGEDSRTWNALYQQRPTSARGTLFQVGKLVFHDVAPPVTRTVRGWDLAATEEGAVSGGRRSNRDPDWTVGVKLGLTETGRYVVLDVARIRGSPDEVERLIVATAAQDGRGTLISLPQDPGQAGKSQVAYFGTRLAGHVVLATPESGSKATRAGPVASQCGLGNLGMLRAGWNLALIAELRDFPAGRKDDQVDALSRAFEALITATGFGGPAQQTTIVHMAR